MENSPHSKQIVSYLDRLTAFASSRLADRELAADAVQISIARALQSSHALRDEEKLLPWLYAILRNTMADLTRTQGREIATESLPEQPFTEETRTQICECFRPLIDTLPSDYGKVLAAVELEGVSREQLAAEMGISVGNLNVKLHRGRTKLREAIESACKMCAIHGCLDCTCDN